MVVLEIVSEMDGVVGGSWGMVVGKGRKEVRVGRRGVMDVNVLGGMLVECL